MNDLHLAGWEQHAWRFQNQDVTVFHREPFRLSWVATKLVTYVFVIQRTPDSYQSVLSDYVELRRFAGENKISRLPFSLQLGYALLPIYVGTGFVDDLINEVESTYIKRWCVMHIPSLFDTRTSACHTLNTRSFWGCVYREFVSETIAKATSHLAPPRKVA